jgi:integrase
MSRRSLEIGQHGPVSITYQRRDEAGKWRTPDVPRRPGAKPRDDERYRARAKYRDPDGVVRDVETYRATKGAAETALLHSLARRGQSVDVGRISPESKVSEAVALWEAEVRKHAGLSVTSQRVYLLTMSTHVVPAIGSLRLREVTVPVLTDLLRKVAAGRSGESGDRGGGGAAKTCRTVLRSFFSLVQRHGAIIGNPVRDVPPIREDKAQRASRAETAKRATKRAFTRAERDAVLSFADADERAKVRDLPDLVAVLAGTGVRIGEALALRWEDLIVTGDEPSARVAGTVVRTQEGLRRQGFGKTETSTRTVPLPPWLAERLRSREERTGRTKPVVFLSGLDPFGRGMGLRDPSNTAHQMRELLDAAGFPWATAHTFSKTVGTLLADAGVPNREIANMLGHARVTTTLDYYQGCGDVSARTADHL